MALRLATFKANGRSSYGAVTGKGLAELIREEYGIRWSVLATSAVLVANLGICISDFVGIGAALGLAGVPAQVTVPIAALGIWMIIVRGSYRSAERIFRSGSRMRIRGAVSLLVSTAQNRSKIETLPQ